MTVGDCCKCTFYGLNLFSLEPPRECKSKIDTIRAILVLFRFIVLNLNHTYKMSFHISSFHPSGIKLTAIVHAWGGGGGGGELTVSPGTDFT